MTLLGSARLVFFILLIQPVLLMGQLTDTTTYAPEWHAPAPVLIEGKRQLVLSFYGAVHSSSHSYLPLYTVSLAGTYVQEAYLRNEVWVSLTSEEEKTIPLSVQVSDKVQLDISNGWERKQPRAFVQLVPLRRNASTGKLEKLVRFGVSVVRGNAPVTELQGAQLRTEALPNSVLAQGEWYKLSFNQTGIYKLDYAYLESLGLDLSQLNSAHLQIWGNGGGSLPEACSAARATDLQETPLYVEDGGDGVFNKGDYVLLYVRGPHVWSKNAREGFYRPKTNIYSNYSYYFLTIGNRAGKRIEKREVTGTSDAVFSTYLSRYVHEQDQINHLASGRRWYGETLGNNSSLNFNMPLNKAAGTGKVYIQSSVMNKSSIDPGLPNSESYFDVSINSAILKKYALESSDFGTYIPIGVELDVVDSLSAVPYQGLTQLSLGYKYRMSTIGPGIGYLNYLAINVEDQLEYTSGVLDFRQLKSQYATISEYNIVTSADTSTLRVWDVSSLSDIFEASYTSGAGTVSFKSQSKGQIREFVAFRGKNFPLPLSFSKINNQNIRGNTTPDFLIVVHPGFKEAALRLADLRRQHDGLEVLVVTTEEVYNEFSSGAQDLVAIRDCARMFYKRPDGTKLKYLLLLGDCSYDYRNLEGRSENASFVPVYESEVSLAPIETYSSDDYVAMLDDTEGLWQYQDLMDLGVGRFPVKSMQEANEVVDKMVNYTTNPATLGTWRQNITFVADDDEEGSDVNLFSKNAEVLTSKINLKSPISVVKNIYVSAYQKEATPTSSTSPNTNKAIESVLNEGTMILDYIGHGGENQWAAEAIMTYPLIQSLTNKDRLPFLITATCDFGRYDDPKQVSGGELFLLHAKGGAIGLLTTTRPVYQGTNETLNDAFFTNLFTSLNGVPLRLGDIERLTKNGSRALYTRNFALLGDPSMNLPLTQNRVTLTSINNHPYLAGSDTLKAQSKTTITGRITDWKGSTLSDFNGLVQVSVYDKKQQVSTLESPVQTFYVQQSKIFDGSATVRNGEFSSTFITPKNINYNIGPGRIVLNAHVENGQMTEAFGSDNKILVGGSSPNPVADNTPPRISLYLNDETFVENGITGENPVLIVKLSDENGISSVGGIGRSIKATLNNDPRNVIVLDGYYQSDRDTYKSGTIRYQMSGLPAGLNSIRIKAFDTDTNSATASLDFTVARTEALSLKNIYNYPNPFTTATTFLFDHNRAGDQLEVLIQVFTVTGKLIKTLSNSYSAANSHFSDLHWDGKDEYGDNIGRGVYVYKVSVKALSDGARKEEFQKLVLLN